MLFPKISVAGKKNSFILEVLIVVTFRLLLAHFWLGYQSKQLVTPLISSQKEPLAVMRQPLSFTSIKLKISFFVIGLLEHSFKFLSQFTYLYISYSLWFITLSYIFTWQSFNLQVNGHPRKFDWFELAHIYMNV